MSAPASNRRNALKWTVFFLAGLFAVLFVLQQLGIKSIYTREVTSDVDFESPEYRDRPMPQSPAAAEDPAVDEVLRDIARLFAGEVFSDPREREKAQAHIRQLSEDEKKYYNEVKKEHSLSDQLRDAENWLHILQASRNTYREVQGIFGASDESTASDISDVLGDPATASKAYRRLYDLFGISEAESRAFADQGNTSVSDWAAWIQKQKK